MKGRTPYAREPLLQLFLRSELAGVTTCPFAAISGTGRKTSVTFAADLFIALVLGGKHFHGGLNNATSETEDKMKG